MSYFRAAYSVRPDIERLKSDRLLSDMDNFIAAIYTTDRSDMFSIQANIISRAIWKAVPPKESKEQKTPVEHMVVTWTFTEPCYNKEDCERAVRQIQHEDMAKGGDDIEYSFLIGGDGNLYEGRGWNNEVPYPKDCKACKRFVGNSIKVAFINKPTNKPTYQMLKAIATIFAIGEEDKYLVKNVKYSRLIRDEVLSFTF